MKPDDPAYWMLQDEFTTTPTVHRKGCYICEDPEFAQMGLPLCTPCPDCSIKGGAVLGHIAADDTVCDDCGFDTYPYPAQEDEGVAVITYVPGPVVTELPDLATFVERMRKRIEEDRA